MLQSIVPCTGMAHPWGHKACVTLAIMDPSLEQARQAFVAGIEQFERHDFEAAAAF
jgi:hypothetical protein